MKKAGNTASLRSMAPHWSLAGDKQLLNVLQDIHQKIMTRGQETNTKLEEMVKTLDGASIDLQNINNKFMALSNSQFIESRVYDDDLDVTVEEGVSSATKPAPVHVVNQLDPVADLAKLKQGLKILESMHDSVRILNSDSDSDTEDDDGRMVYKPKDLYAHRPLPHIIGSQAWKSKWHAGIIPEDSDSDSTTSKPEETMPEQYSESESELTDTRTDRLHLPQRTISSSSSMVDSEPSVPPAPVSQAHIAAELARKLGGNILEVPIESPVPELPKIPPAPTKIYKPLNPATSTIFFDEPPPLDNTYHSDRDEYNDDEDDDIFAELHKRKPSQTNSNKQNRINEDLFGGNKANSAADDLFGIEKGDANKQHRNEDIVEQREETEKKPVGGISVFGSSKGTESISAAILKRNQRKIYSSDEETHNETYNTQESVRERLKEDITTKSSFSSSKLSLNKAEEKSTNIPRNSDEFISEKKIAEKDILQDLFSKNKLSKSKHEDVSTNLDSNAKDKNVNLFDDNLFDDIDDIFTDSIVKVPIKEADRNVKSIFDDDDDDLFADIAITSTKNTDPKNTKAGGLFDSDNDDNLFSDMPNKPSHNDQQLSNRKDNNGSTLENIGKIENRNTKSIFGEDSDEDIFSTVQTNTVKNNVSFNESKEVREENSSAKISQGVKVREDDDNNNLFSQSSSLSNKIDETSTKSLLENKVSNETEQINNKITGNHLISSHDNRNISLSPRFQSTQQTTELSPALFDDDDINDLFISNTNQNDGYEKGDNANNTEEILFSESKETLRYVNEDSESADISDKNIDNVPVNIKSTIKVLVEPDSAKSKEDGISSFNDKYLEVHDQKSQPRLENFTECDIFVNNMENSPLPSVPTQQSPRKESNSNCLEPDVLNDIFNDVPPDFEKSKESKKSKNINALFDDDSDDEALFFKKDDVISDEKPDLSLSGKEDNLFRIFSDEPPAIDIDFSQKHIRSQITEHVLPKQNKFADTDKLDVEYDITTDDTFQTSVNEKEIETNEEIIVNDNIDDTKRSIGKLKPMNFNINVQTLLPGSSPKKIKSVEETDGQTVSVPSIDTNITVEETESKLMKSVSFESDADSELLNNKLSKERAKIQVKRRPSTRRARREAVKKSGIDFGSNDSTDNSSSIDDSNIKIADRTAENIPNETIKTVNTEKDIKSKVVYILNDEDIFTNVNTEKTISQNSNTVSSNDAVNLQYPQKDVVPEFNNDEDLFKNIKARKVENDTSATLNKTPDSTLQRKVDKENKNSSIKVQTNFKKPNQSKASIFDDMSDDETELFQSKKPIATNTKNIFGSDSDEELFANNSKKSSIKTEGIQKTTNLKVEVKKSLFDDDSGDDLFSGKVNSSGKTPVFSKPKELKPSQTQAVLEDPLSLVSNDD